MRVDLLNVIYDSEQGREVHSLRETDGPTVKPLDSLSCVRGQLVRDGGGGQARDDDAKLHEAKKNSKSVGWSRN